MNSRLLTFKDGHLIADATEDIDHIDDIEAMPGMYLIYLYRFEESEPYRVKYVCIPRMIAATNKYDWGVRKNCYLPGAVKAWLILLDIVMDWNVR